MKQTKQIRIRKKTHFKKNHLKKTHSRKSKRQRKIMIQRGGGADSDYLLLIINCFRRLNRIHYYLEGPGIMEYISQLELDGPDKITRDTLITGLSEELLYEMMHEVYGEELRQGLNMYTNSTGGFMLGNTMFNKSLLADIAKKDTDLIVRAMNDVQLAQEQEISKVHPSHPTHEALKKQYYADLFRIEASFGDIGAEGKNVFYHNNLKERCNILKNAESLFRKLTRERRIAYPYPYL